MALAIGGGPSIQAGSEIIRTNPAASNPLAPDYSAEPLQSWELKFTDFQFRSIVRGDQVLPYRFYQPAKLEPGKKYPLVLFFHGAGERGFDNRIQFLRFASVTNFWEKYPCFILAPLCPARTGDQDGSAVWVQTSFGASQHQMKATPPWPMQLTMQLLKESLHQLPVDTQRVYVTGLSMGGFATWDILQREPDVFAAAAPICGGADLSFAGRLANLPLWVFHGNQDDTVPVKRSRDMVAALTAAGGHPRYTEYPGVGHDAWSRTYADMAVWDWLFGQVKKPSNQAD